MTQRNPRPLVIYHANCSDGFSAAWCFWKRYGEGADYVPAVYDKPPPDVSGREVYLVDFSYKRKVVEQMLSVAQSVCLIDHHKSAIEDLEGLHNLDSFTDVNRSGATLSWDFLFPHLARPLLLGHIEDRDLWRFKLAHTREILADTLSRPFDFATWDRLMAADQAELLKMTVTGAAIDRKQHKDVQELVNICRRRMVIGGHEVPVANLPKTYASDAGALMAKGEAFSACYWDTPDGVVFSLRSAPEGADVSVVAQAFGGGGHRHAAGFVVKWGALADLSGSPAGKSAATVPMPLEDAQRLLQWMDDTFGNETGDDWFDADTAAVADGLDAALKRFAVAMPPPLPKQTGPSLPAGWQFVVRQEGSRWWFELTSPEGRAAALSCRGDTICAQVLQELLTACVSS